MMQPAIVSTECPSCGAALDFSEGTNAVACQHCGSQLLVTGRTQLLSYVIAPVIDAREAARVALYDCESAGAPARVRQVTQWLVPYYRMTGHDLRWEWATRERPRDDDLEQQGWVNMLPHGRRLERAEYNHELPTLELRERYIEKSFLACAVEGLGLPVSLGLRPTVLRLRLFRPAQMDERRRVFPPTLSAERAWETGLKAVGTAAAVYRSVLRRVLSIVYQPLWAVSAQANAGEVCLLVDAVTSKVLQRVDEAAAASAEADVPSAIVVGLRPLICPNCGCAFPLKPDEVIGACGSCCRAYAIHGDELRPIAYRLARIGEDATADEKAHVPFWVIDATLEADRLRFHVPAFRYRRLKCLVDLTRALVKTAPIYTSAPSNQFRGCGAVYDHEDAAALAAFVCAAADPNSDRNAKRLQHSPLEVQAANVLWVPYRSERDALIDPFTGRAFLTALLG